MNWGVFAGILLVVLLVMGGVCEILKRPSHIKTGDNVKNNGGNEK